MDGWLWPTGIETGTCQPPRPFSQHIQQGAGGLSASSHELWKPPYLVFINIFIFLSRRKQSPDTRIDVASGPRQGGRGGGGVLHPVCAAEPPDGRSEEGAALQLQMLTTESGAFSGRRCRPVFSLQAPGALGVGRLHSFLRLQYSNYLS